MHASDTTDTGPEAGTAAFTRRVGLIGLGQMGRGMARNLDRCGLLGAASDAVPTAFAAAELSEAVANVGGAALAARSDVILLCVPSTREIRAVAEGPDGLFSVRPRPGTVLVDLTTSDPAATLDLAAEAAAAGYAYMDAAMTGGAAGADAGRLTLMMGGDEVVVARCAPVLAAIAAKTFRLGPVGSGQTMKLVHNMILHTTFLATCEGCRVAEQAGLDLAGVVDVLNAGNARSFVSEVRFPSHILSGRFDARSYVSTLLKDLRMAVELAERLGQPAPFGRLTRDVLERARAAGYGDEDFSRLYQRFAAIAEPAGAAT